MEGSDGLDGVMDGLDQVSFTSRGDSHPPKAGSTMRFELQAHLG